VSRRTDSRSRAYLVGAGAVGIVAFLVLVALTGLPPYVDWLAAWSVSAFLAYGIDKSQAVRGGWRIPEVVLHALALVGGAAGAWAGMLVFHHKLRKPVFILVLVVASIVQLALAYLLLIRG
jgi:uncharacterized membrane protein YsdA (DUF1294 family)